jgi:phytoene desaturase
VNGETILDLVLSGADYHHTETLDEEFRAYSEKYWDSRVLLLPLYCSVGFDKKLKTYHIMLCFLMDFISMQKIFMMQWPKEPLFYANFLLTDKTAARKEWNQVFSCSAGPGINDSEELERNTLIK